MLSKLIMTGGILLTLLALILTTRQIMINEPVKIKSQPLWQIRSIDTMKYSRDLAGQMLTDEKFRKVIDLQVASIAQTGATHVAIATPYDSRFQPFLVSWVAAARKNNLKVWFRGNFSGWEGWFGYSKIDRTEHLKLTGEFISSNPTLFEDGDIFTPCPECENGGPGDPRQTRDIEGHRAHLISEYQLSTAAFGKLGRRVLVGYFSMNYDVASLIMDSETTKKVGGVVVIDHYIKSPEQLSLDATQIAQKSGGKVVFGEFGAPIPDIHGQMNNAAQAEWIEKSLKELAKNSEVIGINYWTSYGGSTQIWDQDGTAKPAALVLKRFFTSFK